MGYFIHQNGATYGPYTIGQLRSMWASGHVTGDTLHCEEGQNAWLQLSVLAGDTERQPEPPPLSPSPPVTDAKPSAYRPRSGDWHDDPASDLQKEKLRFFGCTWEEEITKGQASEALTECVRQFPDKEQAWDNRPATESQRQKLVELDADLDEEPELTYRRAKDWIQELEEDNLANDVDAAVEDAEEILRAKEKEDDDSWNELATACIGLYPWLDWPSYLKVFQHVRAKTSQCIRLPDIVAGVKELFPERFQK